MHRILCVDPGEETGWSIWSLEKGIPICGGQTPMAEFTQDTWDGLIDNVGPLAEGADEFLLGGKTAEDNQGKITVLVIEKFTLYPSKAKELSWNEMRTSQLIGALKFIAGHMHIEVVPQPAKIKEAALAAGAQELFVTPVHENRHCNDSLMHGVWYFMALKHEGLKVKTEEDD